MIHRIEKSKAQEYVSPKAQLIVLYTEYTFMAVSQNEGYGEEHGIW